MQTILSSSSPRGVGETVEGDHMTETDDYVAWCRYTATTIVTCDSDAENAFKVYRRGDSETMAKFNQMANCLDDIRKLLDDTSFSSRLNQLAAIRSLINFDIPDTPPEAYGEPTDDEVNAYLEEAGIDMTEANKRLHEMIAKAKRGTIPMTPSPDYGEPWSERHDPTTGKIELVRSDGHVVGYLGNMLFSRRQRVLKCVNACRGIPDPEEVVPLLVDALKALADSPLILYKSGPTVFTRAIAALSAKREG